MIDERRKAPRWQLFKVIRYVIQGREYVDLSVDVSASGIFLKSTEPPPEGTPVTLLIELSKEGGPTEPYRIKGRVARVKDDPSYHNRGMGVEFHSVSAESVPAIEHFMREAYALGKLNPKKLRRREDESLAEIYPWEYDLVIDVVEPE